MTKPNGEVTGAIGIEVWRSFYHGVVYAVEERAPDDLEYAGLVDTQFTIPVHRTIFDLVRP